MDKQWSQINNIPLGRIAECYSEITFLKNGFEVYSTEADEKGIDFIVKNPKGKIFMIQVKSSNRNNYQFISKSNFYENDQFYVFSVRFIDGADPEMYLFPSRAWKDHTEGLVYHSYNGKNQNRNME